MTKVVWLPNKTYYSYCECVAPNIPYWAIVILYRTLQSNTFQLVVATDGFTQATFVMYLYGELGWDRQHYVRPTMIGHYSTHRGRKLTFQHAYSNTGNGFRMHELVGNRGKKKKG